MDEHHEAEETELDYRSLLESAPDALVMVGDAGEIRFVNSQAERLFGYTAAELVGHSMEVLVPEKYRAVHKKHRATFARAPKLRRMGLHLAHLSGRRKDGTEFLAEINLSPLPGGVTVAAVRMREGRDDAWDFERDRERLRSAAEEREREREHEREQAREREAEREHERAQGRARARKLTSISIPAAIAIVVVAQIVFNLLLYQFLGRP